MLSKCNLGSNWTIYIYKDLNRENIVRIIYASTINHIAFLLKLPVKRINNLIYKNNSKRIVKHYFKIKRL